MASDEKDWDWDADHPDNEGVFYDEEGQKFRPGSPAWKKRLNMIRNKLDLPDLPPGPEFDTPEEKLIYYEGDPEKVYPFEFSGLPTYGDMLEGKRAGHDLLTTSNDVFEQAWGVMKWFDDSRFPLGDDICENCEGPKKPDEELCRDCMKRMLGV